ncbi:MAG: alpha/beta hydrolase [Eubacterium sp.]|nr:alpha/beta hydrolase [Eubacterium sp.]
MITLIGVYVISGLIYFSIYSHAEDSALAYMESRGTVVVNEIDEGYFFDSVGSRDALIFYPGAKVDEKAYAQLMYMIAETGVDCFLVKMPLHMAVFDKAKASDLIEKYDYPCWYISGHSLGGAMAELYLCNHTDKLKGALLLAAYCQETIPDTLPIYSVVGTNDGVLNWDEYNKTKANWPSTVKEIRIEGGNHSQFGDYGFQRGDGEATISRDAQMEQVRDAAVDLIKPEPDYGVTD